MNPPSVYKVWLTDDDDWSNLTRSNGSGRYSNYIDNLTTTSNYINYIDNLTAASTVPPPPPIKVSSISVPTIQDLPDTDRKRAPLEFNSYINASDRLEEFIRYLGTQGVRQSEVMKLPLALFINWLIIEAAKFDGEPEVPEEVKLVTDLREIKKFPRCRYCKRFISKWNVSNGIEYCNPDHLGKFIARNKAA